MKFRSRLVLRHSIIVILFSAVFMFFFQQYNVWRLRDNAKRDLESFADVVSNQLDDMVRPMQFIGDFLLSDSKTLSAIQTLSNANRSSMSQLYVMQAKQDIKNSLTTYCIDKNFDCVAVFNQYGDFISTNALTELQNEITDAFPLLRMDEVDDAMGACVLLSPHSNTWSQDEESVFSLIRLVRGGTYPAYIEVQKSSQALADIFTAYLSGDNRIFVMDAEGVIFFSQLTEQQNLWLQSAYQGGDAQWWDILNQRDRSITKAQYSSYTDLYTVVVQSMEPIDEVASQMSLIIIGVFILICLLSISFVYLSSVNLTAPIRQLAASMEQTNLENMDEDVALEHTNNEIDSLHQAYSHMMKRINQAALREKQLSTLQLQTQFDALQAQVNPHFIYNVLNIVSYKGMLGEGEEVCRICENLAGMLRYSTGTSSRVVTIGHELEYVCQYLSLLKARYQDKLLFDLQIAQELLHQPIPKIVLQQIIENSINHGFHIHTGEMRIHLQGWIEDDQWFVEMRDNGTGFEEQALLEIEMKTREIRKRIEEGTWQLDLDIGGMGLVNAYARMYLLYREKLVFTFSNQTGEAHGAVVMIGAACRMGEDI